MKMIQQEQQQQSADPDFKHQYAHILSFFQTERIGDVARVGQCLGIKVFISVDGYLHLSKQFCKEGDQFEKRRFSQVCGLCRQINIQGLLLNNNSLPLAISQISKTNFPFLKMLCLSYNSIETIDGLNNLSCPQLRQLDLSANSICSLKPLRKVFSMELESLIIHVNKYQELGELLLPQSLIHMELSGVKKQTMIKILSLSPVIWVNTD